MSARHNGSRSRGTAERPFAQTVKFTDSENVRLHAAIERESKPSVQSALREAAIHWIEASEERAREREDGAEREREEREARPSPRKSLSERRAAAMEAIREGADYDGESQEPTLRQGARAPARVVVTVPGATDALLEGLVRHVKAGSPFARVRLSREAEGIIRSAVGAEGAEASIMKFRAMLSAAGINSMTGVGELPKNPLDFLDKFIIGDNK